MTTNEDETIFRTLYSRLRGFLHVHYYRLSREEHDDIIQDTCELLLKTPERWNDNTRDYFPLMCEMVKRRAKDRVRHYRMRENKSEQIYRTQDSYVLSDPATRILYDLDAELTERQAEIFILSLQGYTYKDIMKKLGIAKQTVNTTLQVVRKKLRSKFSSRKRQDHPILRYRTQQPTARAPRHA